MSGSAFDRLTRRPVAAASDQPFPLTLTMVDWALPNAFMAPGGQLVLTRGLVQHAGSSDEVAGVLRGILLAQLWRRRPQLGPAFRDGATRRR